MLSWPVEWKTPEHPAGIIVGCNKKLEFLLPWWWLNYCLHNAYPVTFIDFGDLSPAAVKWCKQHGNYIKSDLEHSDWFSKQYVTPESAEKWEMYQASIWDVRSIFFKKPFSLLLSTYKKTMWIDIDCQVRGSLAPVFDYYLEQAENALVKEPYKEDAKERELRELLPGEHIYNAGVIAFRHGSQLITDWCQLILKNYTLFRCDQSVLSRMLFEENHSLALLPSVYNWPFASAFNPKVVILHWWTTSKNLIPHLMLRLSKEALINLTFDDLSEMPK